MRLVIIPWIQVPAYRLGAARVTAYLFMYSSRLIYNLSFHDFTTDCADFLTKLNFISARMAEGQWLLTISSFQILPRPLVNLPLNTATLSTAIIAKFSVKESYSWSLQGSWRNFTTILNNAKQTSRPPYPAEVNSEIKRVKSSRKWHTTRLEQVGYKASHQNNQLIIDSSAS